MREFVLDNSVCMRWCFRDVPAPYADLVLQRLVDGSRAHVPVLWLYEVASVLAKGRRYQTISASDAADFISDLQGFSITVDPNSASYVLTEIYRLAVIHRLTA